MDWLRAYAAGHTPWDLGMRTPALCALLAAGRHLHWGLPEHARTAVPGCGRGHDVRALAQAGMRAIGFDVVPEVVAEARALLAWNAVEADVLCRDVLGIAHEFGASFDLVYDYTCFCALPRYLREPYAAELAAVLRPGGVLLHLVFPFAAGPLPATIDRPPFPSNVDDLGRSFGAHFRLLEDFEPTDSVPDRAGLERWFVWRRVSD